VTLQVSGSLSEVEPITGLAVYRIVQESLANATRHAPGASVEVSIAVRPTEVDVTVTDTGGPGRSHPAGGVGLVGMRERAEALGGALTAGSAGAGWRVHATLPRAGRTSAAVPAVHRRESA
jgi:signal transduction histidine kinase